MPDLMPFTLGIAAGAVAVFVPWILGPFRKYVLPCSSAHCPHHRDDNIKRIRDANDRERNQPPRPDIH